MKKLFNKSKNSDSVSYIVTHSKAVAVVGVVSVLLVLTAITINLITVIEDYQNEKIMRESLKESANISVETLSLDALKIGRYYPDNDPDMEWYVEIKENNTFELVTNDLYAFFERTTSSDVVYYEESIQNNMTLWGGVHEFEVATIAGSPNLYLNADTIYTEDGVEIGNACIVVTGEGRIKCCGYELTYSPETSENTNTSADNQ